MGLGDLLGGLATVMGDRAPELPAALQQQYASVRDQLRKRAGKRIDVVAEEVDQLLAGLPAAEAERLRARLPIGSPPTPRAALPGSTTRLTPGNDGVVELSSLPEVERAKRSMVLEHAIGTNDLMPIFYLVLGAVRQAAVCRLRAAQTFTTVENKVIHPGMGWGTGFLVSPTLLLTNNHVVPEAAFAGTKLKAQFNFQVDVEGRLLADDEYDFDTTDGFYTNQTLDFTIVRLKPKSVAGSLTSPGTTWGTIPLVAGVDVAEGQFVNIVQHPEGEWKQVAIYNSQLVGVTPNALKYTADTAGGSSGAPVFDNSWRLIGLHRRAGDVAPEGVINNEGVRIQRIIEDVRQNAPQLVAELQI